MRALDTRTRHLESEPINCDISVLLLPSAPHHGEHNARPAIQQFSNSAIQQFSKSISRLILILLACIIKIENSIAGPMVATPGSLAGYAYFPPSNQNNNGTGNQGDGNNVSTLMRCVKQPSINDKTISLGTRNWYDIDKPITVQYKMWGGDGGGGYNGGGGGSSAILKNGAPVAVGPGGNGSSKANMVSGFFTVSKNDTLRFILGGGGGGGQFSLTGGSVGGGGGAGYKGGGAGASATGRLSTQDSSFAGVGGSNTPGAGGKINPTLVLTGTAFDGTPGIDQNGGVSTYSDGSSATSGSYSSNSYRSSASCSYSLGTFTSSLSSKWPATPTVRGSGTISYVNSSTAVISLSGTGGGFGMGGSEPITSNVSSAYSCGWQNMSSYIHVSNAALSVNNDGYSNSYTPVCGKAAEPGKFPNTGRSLCLSSMFDHGDDFSTANRNLIQPTGSLPGNIVIMYQATTCELIPNHNEL